ncbi:MAG: hypothetical protein JKY51_06565 [Opitutaceae bacterium]|nr:hypothetical protein [Opitutaceae bacterium]
MIGKGKFRIILYLMALFLVGVVVGGIVSTKFMKPRPISVERMTERQMKRMIRDLSLTHEQREKIKPMVEDFSRKIRKERVAILKQLTTLHSELYESVSVELTPEQQVKMRQVRENNRMRVRRFRQSDNHHSGAREHSLPPPPPGGENPVNSP